MIDQDHATSVSRYFFLIQPHDLPEPMIANDPVWYLHRTLDEWCGTPGALDPRRSASTSAALTPRRSTRRARTIARARSGRPCSYRLRSVHHKRNLAVLAADLAQRGHICSPATG